eukprot:scaffold29802_cov107-Isochrysis_galbana.AAC.4
MRRVRSRRRSAVRAGTGARGRCARPRFVPPLRSSARALCSLPGDGWPGFYSLSLGLSLVRFSRSRPRHGSADAHCAR